MRLHKTPRDSLWIWGYLSLVSSHRLDLLVIYYKRELKVKAIYNITYILHNILQNLVEGAGSREHTVKVEWKLTCNWL